MLNGIGRLSSVSTRKCAGETEMVCASLLILVKSISWLCYVKMDITYSKSNIVRIDKAIEYCGIQQ